MTQYDIRSLFKTRWVWFSEPSEVTGVDEVVFLSYEDGTFPGFRKKEGLTTVIDLTQSEEALWERMRKNFVRKQIRRGEDAGIVVREGTSEEFLPLYKAFQAGKGFPASAVRQAGRVGTVLVAEHEDTLLAGGLFLGNGKQVRAFALASGRLGTGSGRFREQVGYANRMLLWEAMKRFKQEGHITLDLGGIRPEGAPEDAALAEFKEAFGGVRTPYFFYRKTYSPLLTFVRKLRSV